MAVAIASSNSGTLNQTGNSLAVAITPSGADRGVIILISGHGSGRYCGITSVTVDGNNATQAAITSRASNLGDNAIYYYLAPAASAQNVVVTFDITLSTNESAMVAVYAVTGIKSASPVDNTDSVIADGGDAIGTNLSMAIAADAYAFVIFNDFNQLAVYNGTAGWVENFSAELSDTYKHSAGSHLSAGATENPYANRVQYAQVTAAMASFLTVVAPTVTTQAVSSVTQTTATGNGNVTNDGGTAITERGVCWNTSTNPTTANSKATSAGTTGAYTVSMTGLTQSTLYYARAYAINSVGTSYGANTIFITPQALTMTASTGSFILTFWDAILRTVGITNTSKPTTSFTNSSKPSTTITNASKPSTTIINSSKPNL